jgi:hypothetical protein
MFFLGAYHGLNPGMGWLFSVALGMQRQSARVVWQSLLPIAVGHALAIAVVVTAALTLGVVLPRGWVKVLLATTLVGLGVYKLFRRSHPHWGGMQIGYRDLTIWSFLMATAHGAGLMLLPVLLEMSGSGTAHHDINMNALMPSGGPWVAVLAVAVHTLGYLAITGTVAYVVYEKIGLNALRTSWVNLDLIWAVALIVTAGVALLAPSS